MNDHPCQSGMALRSHGLCKSFGPVKAVDDVSMQLRHGAIHALLGENGAGKTTLASMLYGLIQPDAGEIVLHGKPVSIHRPADSLRLGIGLVQQHFSLIPAFTVFENLLLGQESHWAGWLLRSRAEKKILDLFERYGLSLPLHTRIEELSVGEWQRVEIAKILYRDVSIMMFDEPTAALATVEVDAFLQTLERLKEQGVAILLITHRLPEVMAVADEVTVLRQGRVTMQEHVQNTTQDSIASAIVGHTIPKEGSPKPHTGTAFVEIRDRAQHRLLASKGEIIGIAGVAGNGQQELIDAIFGIHPTRPYPILYNGCDIADWSTEKRHQQGIAYIPQDRLGEALLPGRPLTENFMLNRWAFCKKKTLLTQPHTIAERTDLAICDYAIQTESIYHSISHLSGGHQQRVVIAREMLTHPQWIVAHNPTRGLDIRAAQFVHKMLIRACEEGASVLLFSSELAELFALCHTIAVIYAGNFVGIRAANAWTMEDIGKAMVGVDVC
jgi:general nucleoside transport system ATP-binding protein